MFEEPSGGEPGDFLERAGFFKQMRGARHDLQVLLASEQTERFRVEFDHGFVQLADDEEGRALHPPQRAPRQVRPAAARHDGADDFAEIRGRHERRAAAGAGAEEAEPLLARLVFAREPMCRAHEPLGQQPDIEAKIAARGIGPLVIRK